MPLGYYLGMDDSDHANQLRTISPSVPTADHEISVPPPAPNKCKMLPSPTTPTKKTWMEQENDGSNIGALLMDLGEDGSDDATSTPAANAASTILPTPAVTEARTIPPPGKEAGRTLEKATDPQQKETPKPNWPATPISKSSSSDDDNKDEEYVSCFLECLGLNPDCKTMLHGETKMLAHHERKMGYKAVPIFQQAVNEDPESYRAAWTQITAAVYAMCEAIVRFNTQLDNIWYLASGQGKRKADMEGGRR